MANNAKVMDSIKSFLLKMKALDENIPEELAQDALEMTEEVKDALCEEEAKDEEPDKKEEVKDEDPKEDKAEDEAEVEKKMEDAFVKVLHKYGLIKDSAMSALDELEEEEKAKDADEEDVTVDPEKINDSAKKLIREVKPVIAGIKDAATRKMLADSFAKAVKMNKSSSQYGDMMQILGSNAKNKAKDHKAVEPVEDFGMEIAKKYNPHYMKEAN